MVVITIMRITGLKREGKLDYIWETYWTAIAAEIGLSLVAVSAFRALYVSKTHSRHVQSPITTFNWYHKGRNAVLHIASKVTGNSHSQIDSIEMKKDEGFINNNIPGATMTGVRSYIDMNGRTVRGNEAEDVEALVYSRGADSNPEK